MISPASPPPGLHASALALGEQGLLITGASGAGKSALALALVGAAHQRGDFARLVGDDRIRLEARGGRLIARPHPVIAGRIEARGAGVLAADHLAGVVVSALIEIEADPPRLPEPKAGFATLCGITVPRLVLRADADLAGKVALVCLWLDQIARKSR